MRFAGAIPRWIPIAVVAVAALIVLYGCLDPAAHRFPRCPFLMLTGYECPGCGSQRAIHALLHGNLATAWHYNAMMVVILPIVAALAIASLRRRRAPRFYNLVNSSVVIWGVFVAVILWWIGRNIF